MFSNNELWIFLKDVGVLLKFGLLYVSNIKIICLFFEVGLFLELWDL